MNFRTRWVAAGAAAAAVVAIAIAGPIGEPGGTDGVQLGGTSTAIVEEEPHFVVRAPSLGGARLRHLAESLTRSHQGTVSETAQGVQAILPREALVSVLSELEWRGEIELSLARDPSEEDRKVILRFDLD